MAKSLAIAYQMKKKAAKMAKGGTAFPKSARNRETGHERGVHTARLAVSEPGESGAGYAVQAGDKKTAKDDHKTVLRSLRSDKRNRKNLAEGGEVGCPTCGASKMSEGGQVANDTDMSADQSPDEFDDLVLRDGLEDDSSAGNEIGGPPKSDLVSRAMLKRKAKR